MTLDDQVFLNRVKHDRVVPMIEQIDLILDTLLNHDLINQPNHLERLTTSCEPNLDHDLSVPISRS